MVRATNDVYPPFLDHFEFWVQIAAGFWEFRTEYPVWTARRGTLYHRIVCMNVCMYVCMFVCMFVICVSVSECE